MLSCSHNGCALEIGTITSWKYTCGSCEEMFCSSHFIEKGKISHLKGIGIVKAYQEEGICHSCLEIEGYDGRLWKRSIKEGLCAHLELDRSCTEQAKYPCLSCGHRFCSDHSKSSKGLDSLQREKLVKYPAAEKICHICSMPHTIDKSTILSGQLSPAISEIDHRLGLKIEQIEESLSRVRTETIDYAEKSLSKISDETFSKIEGLADGAESRANQYVLRLAIAGMNFALIYLLVPNIQRWQAIEAVEQSFTAGGILIASIWISSWVFKNLKSKETRINTAMLIVAGGIVLAAKLFVAAK